MTRLILIVLVVGALVACASPTPERQVIDDAAAAIGGASELRDVQTIVLGGSGTVWNVGQDMTMDATSQEFDVQSLRVAIDIPAGRMRVEQTRTPNFLYYQGPDAQQQVYGLDGDVAYTMGADGGASRSADRVAADRRAELYHHPAVLLHAALEPGAALSNQRTEEGERRVDITPADSDRVFTLAIDPSTGRPVSIRSTATQPNLGDVVIETRFDNWANASGIFLPLDVTVTTAGYKTAEFHYRDLDVNEEAGDLTAPAAAREAAAPGPQPVNVTAEPVGRGVWLLAGQSHHSALVEFDDYLLLIEAPTSEARTLAVIAKARETVPGKPLTYLVSTHHHFDHTGGLRAAVAEGLTVITHEGNAAYFEEAAARPHTLAPDALARSPRPITVEVMGDSRVIDDGTQRMELYHLSGNPHSDTLVMAYFPKDRLVVQADAFSSNFDYNPYAANLLEHIRERKLDLDRIVPLHGPPVTFDEFVALVEP